MRKHAGYILWELLLALLLCGLLSAALAPRVRGVLQTFQRLGTELKISEDSRFILGTLDSYLWSGTSQTRPAAPTDDESGRRHDQPAAISSGERRR